ncbi:hypothetical protein ACFVEN_44355 [Streptomyces sp. NPDC057681]|uniref:hypothetical protein n=1 Tax=Streptomyces sp. NPDC057681 TaxID=3346209 RepID=UPI00367C2E63
MLASLLPGLRELRTPLAIGYLYGLGFYLLLGDKLPTKMEAGQHLQPIYDVAHWLGKPTLLAVGAFVAYLLGAVLEVSAATFSRWLRAGLSNVDRRILGPLRRKSRLLEWLPSLKVTAGRGRLISLGATGELSETAFRRISEYSENKVIPRISDPYESMPYVGQAVGHLLGDLPQLPTRLYTASKDMYGDYDRLVAEADLRVNVGLAGTFLSCVMAAQVHVLWLLLVIPMTVLAYRGVNSIRKANDILVQAIVTDLVKPPGFEEYINGIGAGTDEQPDSRYM